MDLHNNIVIAARVMGLAVNPPEIDGEDASVLDSDPSRAASFTLDELSRSGLDKVATSHACFEENDMQYCRLCSFNTYFARNEDSSTSNVRDYFLSLAYQMPLLMSKLDDGGWSTVLRCGHSVNYLSAPVATNVRPPFEFYSWTWGWRNPITRERYHSGDWVSHGGFSHSPNARDPDKRCRLRSLFVREGGAIELQASLSPAESKAVYAAMLHVRCWLLLAALPVCLCLMFRDDALGLPH